MQFYIVHEIPSLSAKLLPDYALKVNIREGWQILSDIGHINEVTWQGQNKLYSSSHALTLFLSSSPQRFLNFIDNYNECLIEYQERFKIIANPWNDKFTYFIQNGITHKILAKLPHHIFESKTRYLLKEKIKHLTKEEVARLTALWK